MLSRCLILSRASNYIALTLGVFGGVALSPSGKSDLFLIVAAVGFLALGLHFWFRWEDEELSPDPSTLEQNPQLT